MKFISFLFIYIFLLLNQAIAQSLLTKSEIIRKSNKCFKDLQTQVCEILILEMEKVQLVESEKNRYKCQSSLLGLQTELVEAYYFKKIKKTQSRIMISKVIKNC